MSKGDMETGLSRRLFNPGGQRCEAFLQAKIGISMSGAATAMPSTVRIA